jgi:hypothetical protein
MPPKKKLKLLSGQTTLSFGGGRGDAESPGEQPEPSTSQSQTDTQREPKAASQPRTFQDKWKRLYPWLTYDGQAMFCSICQKGGCKNTVSILGGNFQWLLPFSL